MKRSTTMNEVFRQNYGRPIILSAVRIVLLEDLAKRMHASFFGYHYEPLVREEDQMEKYGVKTKKPEEIKKNGEKTAGVDDPNINVPKDPDLGTEPFEEKPDGKG
jgi:hypothetical protein